MKIRIILLVIIVVIILPLHSQAWGPIGHRVIGGIAEHYLNPKAKAELKKLLGNESLAMASNWADFIRSDRSFDYLGPWHYINIPGGLNETKLLQYLQKDTEVNVYTRLNFLVRELKTGKLTPEKKVFYLKLLLHLVGDAHNPMHAAHPEDRGGNNIRVYWFNEPTNLHRVWDEHLVDFQQLSYTEYIAAINFTTPEERSKWQRQSISEWIIESYQAAQKLYTEVKANDKLSYTYNYNHVGIVNQQLLKGGVRLAGLLNDIFGK